MALRRKTKIKTLADLARHMRERLPGTEFPSRQRPRARQKRDLRFEQARMPVALERAAPVAPRGSSGRH